MAVKQGGSFTLKGQLADGTKFSDAGVVSADKEIVFYQSLYKSKPKGHFTGKLLLRDVPGVSDLDGTAHWLKRPGTEKYYPRGFDIERSVIGSRFTAPAKGAAALSAIDPTALPDNAQGLFVGGQLDPPIGELPLSWDAKNTVSSAGAEKLKGKVNTKTGEFKASMVHPESKQKVPSWEWPSRNRGVVVRGTSLERQGESGYVLIEPQAP